MNSLVSDRSSPDKVLEVKALRVHFPLKKGLFSRNAAAVRAVDGIDFSLAPGETLGLVGESGCGKSTTGRAILRLLKPTSGSVVFGGVDLAKVSRSQMRDLRGRLQMIFQDPYSSLNPRMTVGEIIREPLDIHHVVQRGRRAQRVKELLGIVGLDPATSVNRYPHEFSGGQRQRIGIARAIAVRPELIVADEPISALDVSIQAQIINLLEDLQAEFHLTYLFISHDLAVVRHISNRIAVMYLGKIVELGDRDDVYDNPMHPYTIALLSAVPTDDPGLETQRGRIVLKGDVPSPVNPPQGCRFHTRCWLRDQLVDSKECVATEPALRIVSARHWAACHFVDQVPRQFPGLSISDERTVQ